MCFSGRGERGVADLMNLGLGELQLAAGDAHGQHQLRLGRFAAGAHLALAPQFQANPPAASGSRRRPAPSGRGDAEPPPQAIRPAARRGSAAAARAITRSAKPGGGSSRRSASLSSSSKRFIRSLSEGAEHLLPQHRQRPLQLALHRAHRHIQQPGDLFRRKLFLVPQHHHHARLLRQRGH